jgi:hypothetical protein
MTDWRREVIEELNDKIQILNRESGTGETFELIETPFLKCRVTTPDQRIYEIGVEGIFKRVRKLERRGRSTAPRLSGPLPEQSVGKSLESTLFETVQIINKFKNQIQLISN